MKRFLAGVIMLALAISMLMVAPWGFAEGEQTQSERVTAQPDPTQEPAPESTQEPTPEPTQQPAPEPTQQPAPEPTQEPVPEPTQEPVPDPTQEPAPESTQEPAPEPTQEPTPEPTQEPVPEPTQKPATEPTQEPAPESTQEPASEPTQEPTPEPTQEPVPEPTQEPAPQPTRKPKLEGGEAFVIGGNDELDVPVRQEPDGQSAIIFTLPHQTIVTVLGVKGDWIQIEYQDQTGYVYKENIPSVPVDAPEEEKAQPKATIFSSRKDVMEPGETVTLTSRLEYAEGYEIRYQWECDRGNGFKAVEGANGDHYSFEANQETLSYTWRLVVYYR